MNWRTFYADSDDKLETRGVRATERPVSFIPKGALTHHPEGGGGIHFVARALCEADAASAEALWTCHTTAVLLSLSTQLSQAHPLLRL